METPWTSNAWLDETEDGKNDNRRQTEGQATFYLYDVWDTADYITMIGEMEKMFESTGMKLNIDYPSYDKLSLFGDGAVFTFFEQYNVGQVRLSGGGLRAAWRRGSGVRVLRCVLRHRHDVHDSHYDFRVVGVPGTGGRQNERAAYGHGAELHRNQLGVLREYRSVVQ